MWAYCIQAGTLILTLSLRVEAEVIVGAAELWLAPTEVVRMSWKRYSVSTRQEPGR